MKKMFFKITAFLLILTSCMNQNNHKKGDSDQMEKTDQDPSTVSRVDSSKLLLDSFQILLDRQTVLLDSLEGIRKNSKVKNPDLDKRIDEKRKKYGFYLEKVEENIMSH